MFVARDKDNELRVYTKKPIRWKEYNIWYVPGDNDGYSQDYELKIDKALYPELTWEDEPIEVDLVKTNYITSKRKVNDLIQQSERIIFYVDKMTYNEDYYKVICQCLECTHIYIFADNGHGFTEYFVESRMDFEDLWNNVFKTRYNV